MTHPTYTQQALSRYDLPRLKRDAVRTLSMLDTMPHAQVAGYEELLDRPFEMLTNEEWESLRESAAA